MMRLKDFENEVDWPLYHKQNNIPDKDEEKDSSQNIPIGKSAAPQQSILDHIKSLLPTTSPGINVASGMMSMAFPGEQGKLVANLPQALMGKQPGIPEKIEQFAGTMLPGIEGGAPEAAQAGITGVKKGLEYINPEAITESLRGQFGKGTVSENINELGQRVQVAKSSAKEDALIPKREFMKEASGKDITRLQPEKVDINNIAKVFESNPGEFTPDRMKAIKRAVNQYYKTGDVDKLAEKGTDIFGNSELTDKQISKLESFLPIEKLNKGEYLSNEDVTKFYSPKGDLAQAHNAYATNKSVESADKLMSELKSNIRSLEPAEKKGTIGDVASAKLESYRNNLTDLKSDWGKFIETLPESAQGKYQDFLKKYAINVGPYEDSGFIVKKLASGDTKGILPDSLNRIFANPNPKESVLKIIKDIGPLGWNNIVYNALSKYKPGDVKGIATAILEGKRLGSPIITDDMVELANKALRRNRISTAIKGTAGAVAGGLAGSAVGLGPLGGAVGAIAPYALANKDLIAKALAKFKK